MPTIALWRLYLLRAAYLLMAVGLGVMIWPLILNPPGTPEHMRGVVRAMLGGLGLLALLGVRYPLRMLPLLLFELVWKTIWLIAIGLPLRAAGTLESVAPGTWSECVFGVVFCVVVIPWDYVLQNYVRAPGDPWKRP